MRTGQSWSRVGSRALAGAVLAVLLATTVQSARAQTEDRSSSGQQGAGATRDEQPVPAPQPGQEHIARARELLDLFLTGEDDAFVAAGTQVMKDNFKPAQSAAIRTQFVQQFGDFQAVGDARYERIGEYDAVFFQVRHEQATLNLQVTLDDAGRLAGFHIKGVESNEPYAPPEYADQSKFREEKVTVRTGEFELPGTVTIPLGDGPHPGIVLVHGSGPHDEDETLFGNKPFKDLAWGLASRGIVVLRYEKRTHKYGAQMDAENITFEQETIDDAVSAAKLLRERPDVDDASVYVLGHSLGGMAAPYIAKRDPQLAGIVIMAGNARSILELVEDQVDYLARLDGEITDQEREQIEQLRAATKAIRAGRADEVEGSVLGAPAKYWAHLHERDPAATASDLKARILIVHGGRDYQVSDKDLTRWKAVLGERQNVTYRAYPELNHLMMTGEGPSAPTEYMQGRNIDERVVRDVAAWITAG